jgi:hypothetical protein
VDNHSPFPQFCIKTDNGFVARENCFVATARRNNSAKGPISQSNAPIERGFSGTSGAAGIKA